MINMHFFNPDSKIPDVTPIDWDVEIYDRPYYVAHFPGFVHSYSGRWGDNDLWAWPRDEEPMYENLIAFDGDGGPLWGIEYKPARYTKTKHDETRVHQNEYALITRNGKPFYYVHGDMNYAIDAARVLITRINEHPIDFNVINYVSKIIGQKVWWKDKPAVVGRWCGNGEACVILILVGGEREKISIFDQRIDWYRE